MATADAPAPRAAATVALSQSTRIPIGGGKGPQQPIAFSHKIHAGDFKIDCQYCHADARRSTYAGIPSVKRCMGCHQIVASKDAELQKQLVELATAQDQAKGKGTAIPATFMRVTVQLPA